MFERLREIVNNLAVKKLLSWRSSRRKYESERFRKILRFWVWRKITMGGEWGEFNRCRIYQLWHFQPRRQKVSETFSSLSPWAWLEKENHGQIMIKVSIFTHFFKDSNKAGNEGRFRLVICHIIHNSIQRFAIRSIIMLSLVTNPACPRPKVLYPGFSIPLQLYGSPVASSNLNFISNPISKEMAVSSFCIHLSKSGWHFQFDSKLSQHFLGVGCSNWFWRGRIFGWWGLVC